jgi:tRNA dimethylallyltransferase
MKALVICGSTATGKTSLAIKLAKKFDGELLSADSRQVYQAMDIVTGKEVGNEKIQISNEELQKKIRQIVKREDIVVGNYTIDSVSVWGLDLVSPDQEFDVATYGTLAREILRDIHKRKKLAIVVGGTGQYLEGLFVPKDTYGVPKDPSLRTQLEQLSIEALKQRLQATDPKKWQQMNNSDRNNPRRLIRAIEVRLHKDKHAKQTTQKLQKEVKGEIIDTGTTSSVGSNLSWTTKWIGLQATRKVLAARIRKRVEARLAHGVENELNSLITKGYDWSLPAMTSLGYQELYQYQSGKLSKQELIETWTLHEMQYAKRQMTWFTAKSHIQWQDISDDMYVETITANVREWL